MHTALTMAASKGDTANCRLLINAGAPVDYKLLLTGTPENCNFTVKIWISTSWLILWSLPCLYVCLIWSVILKLCVFWLWFYTSLISQGGYSAIVFAAMKGHIPTTQLFLSCGVDINMKYGVSMNYLLLISLSWWNLFKVCIFCMIKTSSQTEQLWCWLRVSVTSKWWKFCFLAVLINMQRIVWVLLHIHFILCILTRLLYNIVIFIWWG